MQIATDLFEKYNCKKKNESLNWSIPSMIGISDVIKTLLQIWSLLYLLVCYIMFR